MEIAFPPIRRGYIYYINFDNLPGSSVHGIRPAIIVQNNIGNLHAPKFQGPTDAYVEGSCDNLYRSGI